MQLPALEIDQQGRKFWISSVPISFFAATDRVKVDQFNAQTATGYQRRPSSTRARDFARYLEKARGISPTAILLNVRGEIGEFRPVRGSSMGMLELAEDTEFWIVDGQHRVEGFRELLSTGAGGANFDVPVVIMHEDSEYEEAKQFIIVNKTQKGVKPDLAERFIARMVRRERPQDLDGLPRETTREIEWRPRATDLVDMMNTKNSEDTNDEFFENPWFQKIQLPNDPKGTTVVSQKSFEDSLKQVLNSDTFQVYSNEELATLLVRYWRALRSLFPEAFDVPKSYVIQRTAGVFVLHRIMPRVTSIAARNGSRITQERLRDVLRNMGDASTEMFWHVDGVAGQLGSGSKSIGILVTKLIDWLEEANSQTGEPGKAFLL